MAPPSPPPSPPPSVSSQAFPHVKMQRDIGVGDSPYLITPSSEDSASLPQSAMRDALRKAGRKRGDSTGSTSEEDYDKITQSPDTLVMRRKRPAVGKGSKLKIEAEVDVPAGGLNTRVGKLPEGWTEDEEIREVLRRGLLKAQSTHQTGPKFRDLVFTRQFSAFDGRNESAANSPFHGFFTLFWMGVALFVFKIGAENWRNTGNVLGTNEIMKGMSRDLVVMLASDGVMVSMMAVTWAIQLLVFHDYLDWNRSGWIIQNVWQTIFLSGVVGLPLLRSWPWTHNIFFVLHGIAMLMKHHSYAFYNGHLSTAYKKRQHLLAKLKRLDHISPLPSPSITKSSSDPLSQATGTDFDTIRQQQYDRREHGRRPSLPASLGTQDDIARVSQAIDSGKPLEVEQIQLFESIIKAEINSLTDELQGKASSPEKAYPNQLTVKNAAEFIVLPTLVYELEYPRSETINWGYVAEKSAATVGIILVMIMISQARMYPIITRALSLKASGVPISERLQSHFPWLLLDLLMPFMMEYLLAWYVIWEAALNLLAEITYFADRSFYDAWWNSVSWDQFARDWNRPVHNFLLRHVYHSSISSMKVNKHTATVITFLLSAAVHELVMWCIFKKLRGYLMALQMCQVPLVSLSRTKFLKGRKTLGNMVFWLGIFLGPSLLCSLYIVI